MTGRVRLILNDLSRECSPEEISITWGITPNTVRSIARRYELRIKQTTKDPEEQKRKKKLSNKRRYELNKNQHSEGLSQKIPYQAFKKSALNSLDVRWTLRQASQRSSLKTNQVIQEKYGLKTARLA